MPTAATATATATNVYNSASICFSTRFLRSYTYILCKYISYKFERPRDTDDESS